MMPLNKMSFIIISVVIRIIMALVSAESTQVHNSERMTISLGEIDDLEMIPESKNHALVNQKLKRFHNFVKNAKIMKHPWEKLFIKNTEYRKSEQSYVKLLRNTIEKMKNNGQTRNRVNHKLNINDVLKLINHPSIDKRQLENVNDFKVEVQDGVTNDDDDDDDDGDKDNTTSMQPNIESRKLENEYGNQINEEKEKVFKYSDKGKPEESVNEAFQKIIDLKTPDNCTKINGFGIQSLECLLKNFQAHQITAKEAIMKFFKIFLIWIDIYLTVAVPLWCIKGWGCCCITWEYCHPQKMVKDIQEYISENPPGVYINELGEEEHYAPSLREKQLYEKINKEILRI